MRYILAILIAAIFTSCNSTDEASGDDLFDKGRFAEAVEAYTTYLQTHPDHIKSIYNRGRSFEEVGNLPKAVTDFEKVIEVDPQNANAYLSLAKISYGKSEFNKTLVYTGSAIKLNENLPQAHFLAGRAEHQLGYLDQALESYNNAISINKDFGEAYLYRGAVKVGKKSMKSACEDFRAAQSLNVAGAKKAVTDYCK